MHDKRTHKTTRTGLALGLLAIGALPVLGCRGGISEKPPVHLVLDMDFQQKYDAQERSEFANWPDQRAMREPPPHTVMRRRGLDPAKLTPEELAYPPATPPSLLVYQNKDSTFVAQNPVPATEENVLRGMDRYFIFCSTCHGRTGEGGLVARRWPSGSPVPDLTQGERADKVRGQAPGEIYQTITNGYGTMPSYAKQLSPEDRWKIVHFLKALQEHMN